MPRIAPGASKDVRPGHSRAVALRGPLKKRPPQGDGDEFGLPDARQLPQWALRRAPLHPVETSV